ncbi:MAG: alpha/beta hydrolase [Acidobacteriota bacterium]
MGFPATAAATRLLAAAALLLGVAGCAARSRLAELPAGWSRGSAQVGERTVSWVVAGREPGPGTPTLLFIHGSPGSWRAWRGYLADPGLAARAHLVAVDRPGFGASGRGRFEPSLERQAAAAAAPLLARPGGPTLVVGHSFGGPVAARLAVDRPDLVDGLLLIAPSLDPDLEEVRWYQRLAQALPFLVPRDLRTANREILPLAGELEALAVRMPEIRQPVTVLQGLEDRLVPPGNADFAERTLTGAPLEVQRLPGVDHFIPWRRAELVRTAVESWLAGLDG